MGRYAVRSARGIDRRLLGAGPLVVAALACVLVRVVMTYASARMMSRFSAGVLRNAQRSVLAGLVAAFIAPIVLLGWFSQKQLVRGLTFGAVK